MPIDRAATLRNAELLVRQGKLDVAIAAYSALVEDQPADWSTANTLGDLYVRAGQAARAAEQFTRTADVLGQQGFLAKAGALYTKALKLNPDDEHALLQAAEIAAAQGLLVDARSQLGIVAERRAARGDARGAAEIRVRIDTLDPSDYRRHVAAAETRAAFGDADAAVRELKSIARELDAKERADDAVEVLRRALAVAPADAELRSTLMISCVESGDFTRARELATTVEEIQRLAHLLEACGRSDAALESLRDAARLAPADDGLARRVARGLLAGGDTAAAEAILTADAVHPEPDLLLMAAEGLLRAQEIDKGLAFARRFLEEDPQGREPIAMLSCSLAAKDPEAGFRLVELALADTASRLDWAWSAAVLQEIVRCIPTHVPALLRLVEICMDGELDADMYEAQAQLADAYIASGAGTAARAIAEDLVDRAPEDERHVERLRRALRLLNELDAEALVTERVRRAVACAQGGTLSVGSEEAAPPVAEAPPAASLPPRPVRKQSDDPNFALGANAIDIESILGEVDSPRPDHGSALQNGHDAAARQAVEVDLSRMLDEIHPARITAADLDGVFSQMRAEVGARSPDAAADASHRRALVLQQAGDIEGCIGAFEQAARAPSIRCAAGSRLARLLKQRGRISESIEWFERAAEAAAPASSESRDLLYELADGLETSGERERALAVCLELQADAGPYRDVASRIDRLTGSRVRG